MTGGPVAPPNRGIYFIMHADRGTSKKSRAPYLDICSSVFALVFFPSQGYIFVG